ncbi:hypothetical protein HMPREF9248_1120 [Fannyhessea vaginae PB189-T1-4]|uniref:Uncharacterized protein n=1 Tax=Fannyhessea vaginae PB189-T1-4 TaxID=866774 RepID=A0ABP2IZM0_9ACTN|nr:hypothetical protein HMPREF9248_1120 [Fannyhessea vaginae PB189-T1-4]
MEPRLASSWNARVRTRTHLRTARTSQPAHVHPGACGRL